MLSFFSHFSRGPGWLNQLGRSLDLTTHTSLSPMRRGFASGFVDYKKRCTRLAAASDKVYQLLAHGQWLSPGTPASSTTKTGRHDIAEILLKVALKHQKSNQNQSFFSLLYIVLSVLLRIAAADYLPFISSSFSYNRQIQITNTLFIFVVILFRFFKVV